MATPVPAVDMTNPPSPKTIAAGLVALLVPGIQAALMYLQTDQGVALYAALPIWLVVVVKGLIAGTLTWLVSYNITDAKRVLDLAASPKTVFATLAAVVVQVLIDFIGWFSTGGATLYAAWPPVLVVGLQAVLPMLAALLAGYIKVDPARQTSKNPTPQPIKPPESYPAV